MLSITVLSVTIFWSSCGTSLSRQGLMSSNMGSSLVSGAAAAFVSAMVVTSVFVFIGFLKSNPQF